MPSDDHQLDVRSEPRADRHQIIFGHFDELDEGDGFVLANDHDPIALHRQFVARHPEGFDWQYLEQGPDVWRVRIGRRSRAA